jgi:hypothetical protein
MFGTHAGTIVLAHEVMSAAVRDGIRGSAEITFVGGQVGCCTAVYRLYLVDVLLLSYGTKRSTRPTDNYYRTYHSDAVPRSCAKMSRRLSQSSQASIMQRC